jgi:phosphate transport system substrate-binding protein
MIKIILSIFVFILPLFGAVKLHFAGSTTIQPIFEDLKPYIQKNFNLNPIIEGGGSQKGLEMLSNNMIDIAMVSRDLSDEEKEKYNYVTLGYDGLAIIVHKENPINKISTNQLRDIYSGKTRNWKELDLTLKSDITVISKMIGRGTLDIFEHYIKLQSPKTINKKYNYPHITKKAWEAGANNDVIVWVGGIKDAIGFVSIGSIKEFDGYDIPIKALPLDLVQPSSATIQNKSYPIVRELNLVYQKSNTKAASFIKNLQNPLFDTVVEKHHFIRAKYENK